MIGEDTFVLTRKGFKKVRDLVLYEEVMTGFGTFEPIVEMSSWEVVDKCVKFNTYESIYCSDDLLWNIGPRNNSYTFTDELNEGALINPTCEFDNYCKKILYPAYDFAVVVPTCVPVEYLTSSLDSRLKFMSGLIDSPICEVSSDGIYCFYTRYIELITGIVSLARSIGWYVKVDNCIDNVYCISVYMSKYVENLSINDKNKRCYGNCSSTRMTKVIKIDNIKNSKVLGRKIKVNGGSLLLGYSFIPVS